MTGMPSFVMATSNSAISVLCSRAFRKADAVFSGAWPEDPRCAIISTMLSPPSPSEIFPQPFLPVLALRLMKLIKCGRNPFVGKIMLPNEQVDNQGVIDIPPVESIIACHRHFLELPEYLFPGNIIVLTPGNSTEKRIKIVGMLLNQLKGFFWPNALDAC